MVIRLLVGGVALVLLAGASAVPDDAQSPGVSATTNRATICGDVGGTSYSKRHRSGSMERSLHCPAKWQADHRLPLSAGGADVRENLWCQPPDELADGHLGWRTKDGFDDWAWWQICHHGADPVRTQKMFLAPADWRDGCKKAGICH